MKAEAFFFVFLRVGVICSFLPGFGESSLSIRLKIAIGLSFSVAVFFSVDSVAQFQQETITFEYFASEILVGLFIGLLFRLFVLGLQTAGTIAAQSTSLSQILGTAGVDPMPAIGHVLVISGICLYLTAGLHLEAISFFIASYDFFPMGQVVHYRTIYEVGVGQVADVFQIAFTLASPFVILSLLYNLFLGVLNKAMPQLMVAFVGAPFITFGGLFVLFATAPIVIFLWVQAIDRFALNLTR